MSSFAERYREQDLLELALVGDEANTELPRRLAELEAKNQRAVSRLRKRLSTGCFSRVGLWQALERGPVRTDVGYDWQDALLGDLLRGDGAPAEAREPREREMVDYQPTPVRIVLQMLRRTALGPGDVLCDLGSGLGHVVLLSALLTGARALGVEREPAFCEYAERARRALGIQQARFRCADVRNVDLEDADVFFLYTPFRGTILRETLEKLRRRAQTRAICIASYGPCTLEISGEPWLRPRHDALGVDELAVFDGAG